MSRKTNDSVPLSALALLKLLYELIVTSVLSETTSSFPSPRKRTIILGEKMEFEGKRKKRNYTSGTSISPFFFMPQGHLDLISKSTTLTEFHRNWIWRGKTVREEQGKNSCLWDCPPALFFQGRKGLLETCADSTFQ